MFSIDSSNRKRANSSNSIPTKKSDISSKDITPEPKTVQFPRAQQPIVRNDEEKPLIIYKYRSMDRKASMSEIEKYYNIKPKDKEKQSSTRICTNKLLNNENTTKPSRLTTIEAKLDAQE